MIINGKQCQNKVKKMPKMHQKLSEIVKNGLKRSKIAKKLSKMFNNRQ